jgi:hypothetical protein
LPAGEKRNGAVFGERLDVVPGTGYTQPPSQTAQSKRQPGEVIMRCPACSALNAPENQRCQTCGQELPSGKLLTADEDAEVLAVLPASAEDIAQQQLRPSDEIEEVEEVTDIVSTFIPYKNPKALAAYYCGFFALFPGLGFILGAVALILGIQGVRYATVHPEAKGMAHAITGLILGVTAFFCWNPLVCFLLWLRFGYVW